MSDTAKGIMEQAAVFYAAFPDGFFHNKVDRMVDQIGEWYDKFKDSDLSSDFKRDLPLIEYAAHLFLDPFLLEEFTDPFVPYIPESVKELPLGKYMNDMEGSPLNGRGLSKLTEHIMEMGKESGFGDRCPHLIMTPIINAYRVSGLYEQSMEMTAALYHRKG